MCGIGGIYHFNQDSEVAVSDLVRIADQLKHRGPKNQGIFNYQNMGLAYRRLSIIDTNEQDQPILTNEKQNLRISYNGEVYNFHELKEELVKKGHKFYTGTDTETVLHLYEEEGENFVKKLNGIFAFAITDNDTGTMFIARDQIGIKPLYYTYDSERLTFASEIKALLEMPWVRRSVNREAFSLYFRYRFVPDPLTMFDGIFKLPPGHWMKVTKDGVEIQPYWSLSEQLKTAQLGNEKLSEEDSIKRVRDTLKDSVKRQLMSDVPLGAFLSGGIDSSIVVGLMSQMKSDPVETFSIGFSEQEYDEVRYARQISEKFKTNHHELVLKPAHVQKLPEIIWHLDEPLADPAAVPTYFLSEMTSKEVTVVLTGEGGDELFAGYKEDFQYKLSGWFNVLPDTMRIGIAELIASGPDFDGKTRLYRSILPERSRAEHILLDVFRFDDPPILPNKILSRLEDDERYHNYSFDYYWERSRGLDWLSRLLYLETKIWLPGDPLMKVDKMSMAHALEARVPILDLEMVKLATQIPVSLKNKNGVAKYVLRQAFSDLLPDEIFNRPKTAFEIPVNEWLKGELKDFVAEYLSKERLSQSGLIDVNEVNHIVQSHLNGKRNYKYEVWALLVFQIWWEQWFKN